jgi:hypothetical protein
LSKRNRYSVVRPREINFWFSQAEASADVRADLAGLSSSDEEVRARALRQLCPCGSWQLYERHMDLVRRFTKDPSPLVRSAALHIEHEVIELESQEAAVDSIEENHWRCTDRDWVHRRLAIRRHKRGY